MEIILLTDVRLPLFTLELLTLSALERPAVVLIPLLELIAAATEVSALRSDLRRRCLGTSLLQWPYLLLAHLSALCLLRRMVGTSLPATLPIANPLAIAARLTESGNDASRNYQDCNCRFRLKAFHGDTFRH